MADIEDPFAAMRKVLRKPLATLAVWNNTNSLIKSKQLAF